jgi:hypothetical protein
MNANDPFYREIDARLESAFAEIERPTADVSTGQESLAVARPGVKGNHHGRSA